MVEERHFIRGTGTGVESGYTGLLTMAEAGRLPSAVFAARDNIAVGMLRAALERNIRVPEELSILGYDDIQISDYLYRKLTTIRQPAVQIGEKAAELLLRRLEGHETQQGFAERLVPEIVVRESA